MAVEREKIYECEVKRRRVKEGGGTVPYVEHKSPSDSEYCASGMLFKKATDGREPRHSEHPVE